MARDTVGKLSSTLLNQEDFYDPSVSVVDQQREMQKDYEKNVYEAVERGKTMFQGDFFIAIETKKERLMVNVIRNYFIPRLSCPTPTYDQTVFRYDRKQDMIEFIWTVPAKDICEEIRDHALHVPVDQHELRNFVIDFYDDTLTLRAKKLNGEELNTPFLEK